MPGSDPRTWLSKRPGFRVEDIAGQVHNGRVSSIYYALSRYGQQSQRWYRVSVLDKKTNAYDLPADVLTRVIKRGILADQNSRDIWGRRFKLRKRKEYYSCQGYCLLTRNSVWRGDAIR